MFLKLFCFIFLVFLSCSGRFSSGLSLVFFCFFVLKKSIQLNNDSLKSDAKRAVKLPLRHFVKDLKGTSMSLIIYELWGGLNGKEESFVLWPRDPRP